MSRSHSSSRTCAEWVAWAHSEGFTDIVGQPSNGLEVPGKVYCSLCCKLIVATASGIKQHCVGYYAGTGDARTFHESLHASKAKRRDQRVAMMPSTNPPGTWTPPTIVVQVFPEVFVPTVPMHQY